MDFTEPYGTPNTSEVTSIFVDNQKFVVDNQKFVLTTRNLLLTIRNLCYQLELQSYSNNNC